MNYVFITFGMIVLFMYHVFCCVNELLWNAMECLIIAVTRYVSLCNLNVLIVLNAFAYNSMYKMVKREVWKLG